VRQPPPSTRRPDAPPSIWEPLVPFYVWWAIPLLATLFAVGWLSWRARERQIDPHDSVAERRRFIAAMETPPVGRRPSRPGPAATDDVTADESSTDEPTSDAGRGATA
jgi:hypothetical protein